MSIRSELEARLGAFASAQVPVIPVSYQGVPFNKPVGAPFIECFIISAGTTTVTTDATRKRERGTFQINVWWPSGVGAGKVEALAQSISALYPVVPKTGTVSIEDAANTGQLILDVSGWIICPVSFPYRQEQIS